MLFNQQAADELGGDDLGGAGEEALGEELGGVGGYGSGFVWKCWGLLACTGWQMGDNGRETFAPQTMSEEQLKAFMEAVKADAGLQEKLNEAGDADAVVSIAKQAGFLISLDELQRAQAEISERGVDGGTNATYTIVNCPRPQPWHSHRPTINPGSPCHHRGFLFLQ